MNENLRNDRRTTLVLAGGIGLGAYEAGAYSVLHEHEALRPDWIAAASVGGVNGAVIAGNAPNARIPRLQALWAAGDPWFAAASESAARFYAPWRHLQSWANALQGRMFGAPGHFLPRFVSRPFQRFSSFYDLAPLRARIEALIDFGRLNSGEVRFSVAMTDIETGEMVVFDTARGERIEPDHLLASCGYLPEFAPLEIGGRLFGDGGLSTNAPVEAVLFDDRFDGDRVCFVVDLFARDGTRPEGLEAALERKNDLMFAYQTWMRLEAIRRELELCDALASVREEHAGETRRLLARRSRIRAFFHLSYRAPSHEAGPEKTFDLSMAAASERWQAGALDMREGVRMVSELPASAQGCALFGVRRR